jgi:hypothetical protein
MQFLKDRQERSGASGSSKGSIGMEIPTILSILTMKYQSH